MIYDIGDTLEKISQKAKVKEGIAPYPIGSRVKILDLLAETLRVIDDNLDIKFIPIEYLIDWKIECEFHRWKQYEGFTRKFQFCTKCDLKWE